MHNKTTQENKTEGNTKSTESKRRPRRRERSKNNARERRYKMGEFNNYEATFLPWLIRDY